jgi:uncharacterized damage-inducible protein DinB
MRPYLLYLLILASQAICSQNKIQNQMVKDVLLELLIQNQTTNNFALKKVSSTNISLRLNDSTASIGFIYRHIGESIHLFGTFLGEATSVQNTTMGQSDSGQGAKYEDSRQLLESGYVLLANIIHKNSDEWWFEETDTPFFGKVTRLKLFSHILYHNSHHAGQISLTLSRGEKSK